MDFDGFISHMECIKKCTPSTIKSYRSDLELFQAFLREKLITRLSRANHAVIKDYIAHMRRKPNPRFGKIGLADSSIARRLAAVSSYFDYIRSTADSKFRNPIVELSNRWQMSKDPKPVDEMTLGLIITGITDLRDRTIFTLFLSTGLRISEMAQLNRDSIEMAEETDEDGTKRLIGRGKVIGKGRKPRTFYVDRVTLPLLSKYLLSRQDDLSPLFLSLRHQRMSVRAIQERLGYWCRRLNAPHINVHRLRHTFATRLINGNISSMILKDLLGHESLGMTLRYARLNDSTVAQGYFAAMEYVKIGETHYRPTQEIKENRYVGRGGRK